MHQGSLSGFVGLLLSLTLLLTSAPAKAAAPPLRCEYTHDCRDEGRCTQRNGECVAASLRECQASRECVEDGVCDWDPDELQCDKGRRNNFPLMVTGICMLGLGGGVGLNTFLFWLAAGLPDDLSDTPLIAGMAISTGGLLALGTAFTAVGAVRVDRGPAYPDVALGPGSLHLLWNF